jgi:Na+/H+ antiporter NhaD/arsenite permease-like protein
MVSQRLGTGTRSGWLFATLPTLFLILFGFWSFIEYMQIAGGLVALVVVYVTVPMFLRARREHPTIVNPGLPEIFRSPAVLGVFILGMVLMAVGSLLNL